MAGITYAQRLKDGETVPTYTTMVRPDGVRFIGRKLAQAVAAVEEAGVLA